MDCNLWGERDKERFCLGRLRPEYLEGEGMTLEEREDRSSKKKTLDNEVPEEV